MAEPQKQGAPKASTVASCSATDCIHNENEDCMAGTIRVDMSQDGHAVCRTYQSESPRTRP